MHGFLNRFRRGSSSAAVTEEKKSKSSSKNKHSNNQSSNSSEFYQNFNSKNLSSGENDSSKVTIPNQTKNQQFTISLRSSSKRNENGPEKNSKSNTKSDEPSNKNNTVNNKNNLNVFGLIIDPKSDNTENIEQSNEDSVIQLFDPEPAPEEADTSNQITYIDDRNFIFDDEEDEIKKLEGLAETNNCFTINEVPEGRLSKLSSKSSRASSRSSIASDSTRGSSNLIADRDSDNLSGGHPDFDQSNDNKMNNGSKNVLLDALIKKFNVSMELDTNDNNSEKKADTNESAGSDISGHRPFSVKKQPIKYHGEDQRRKQQSDLQRKINRSNLNKSNNNISDTVETCIDASSSMDDAPKPIKVVKSSSTQVTRTLNKRNKNYRTISVTRLPQNFDCKYIGKTRCTGLWGLKHIRDPVDYLVTTSRQLRSLNELPDVEALISEKGIYIVQKSAKSVAQTLLEEKFKPDHTTNAQNIPQAPDVEIPELVEMNEKTIMTQNEGQANITEKYYQSGLLPISNISYAVQDNLYGKVFSCIIVRECEGKTISECYSFLCKQNEIARRMALSITLAFKEYGKLLQLKETRINRKIEIHGEKNDSFV